MKTKLLTSFKLAFLCLLLIVIVSQGYQVKAETTTAYVWKNAPIDGGGFVTGLRWSFANDHSNFFLTHSTLLKEKDILGGN